MQTLDIVAENPDKFRVVALAAGSNVTLLADQVYWLRVLIYSVLSLQFVIQTTWNSILILNSVVVS